MISPYETYLQVAKENQTLEFIKELELYNIENLRWKNSWRESILPRRSPGGERSETVEIESL